MPTPEDYLQEDYMIEELSAPLASLREEILDIWGRL
jgi:hypothetical protein